MQRLPASVSALKKKKKDNSKVEQSSPTDLRQLVLPPEVGSHLCSLRVLLSVRGFPQLPANAAGR